MGKVDDPSESTDHNAAPQSGKDKPTAGEGLTPPESEEAHEGAAALTAEEQRVPTNRSM